MPPPLQPPQRGGKAIAPGTFSRVSKVRFDLGQRLTNVSRRPGQRDEQLVEIHLDRIVVKEVAHDVAPAGVSCDRPLNSVRLTR